RSPLACTAKPLASTAATAPTCTTNTSSSNLFGHGRGRPRSLSQWERTRGEGIRGRIVCQQDNRRKDARSKDKVAGQRPGAGPPLCAPHTDTAAPEAPGHEAAQQGGAQRVWKPLRSLLALRTFAALHHREFLLLWS